MLYPDHNQENERHVSTDRPGHNVNPFMHLETEDIISGPLSSKRKHFDGVICFGGEDWWYHNRGHYDLQIMRELSKHFPVLYVNSIGMRLPCIAEGKMFFHRIRRKLKSLGRGYRQINDHFAVCSPFILPGRIGMKITGRMLAPQVRRWAERMGLNNPLVWVACPSAAVAIDGVKPSAVVYQRTDRHECFSEAVHDMIKGDDDWLKARSDLTVFCSSFLYEQEFNQCRNACLIDHGVDFEQFSTVEENPNQEPEDIRALGRPRVGFVGGIDNHTFDPDLFLNVARLLSDVQFVLVGACSLPKGWCHQSNVAMLGKKPYSEVARYMAACDVLIMPWNHSRWIEACNPVKLKEYLAAGRPIISTSFPELVRYRKYVNVADTPEEFARAIRHALTARVDPSQGRDLVRNDTWTAKADEVLAHLAQRGIVAKGSTLLLHNIQGNMQRLTLGEQEVKFSGSPHRQPDSSDVLAVIGSQETRTISLHLTCGEDGVRDSGKRSQKTYGHDWDIDIAACIILAGTLRNSPLVEATNMSVLDLPITTEETLLDTWVSLIRRLPQCAEAEIRVICYDHSPSPSVVHDHHGRIRIERNPQSYRGSAGLVRDMCRHYHRNQSVLVIEGSRYGVSSLEGMFDRHSQTEADVTVGCNPDRSPAGIYLIRVEAFRGIADDGFVDLKEQWLGSVREKGMKIEIHGLDAPGFLPVRTLEQFLVAARYARHAAGQWGGVKNDVRGLVRSDDARGLRVICQGALIAPGARVIDSIVMGDTIVSANATVVRCLICSGTRIQSGVEVADSVISDRNCLSDHG